MAANVPLIPLKPPLPVDRCLGFAQQAQKELNGALVLCEERYPEQGAHSVLYVVVDKDPAQWRERLSTLHQEYLGPGQIDPLAPVQLEVVDRATDEALQRLLAAGLIGTCTRASRPLLGNAETPPGLSDAEQKQMEGYVEQAKRKLKMARLLGTGGMLEETRPALLEAAWHYSRALAVRNRFPEPSDLNYALQAPLSHLWKESLPVIREYVETAEIPWQPVLETLEVHLAAQTTS